MQVKSGRKAHKHRFTKRKKMVGTGREAIQVHLYAYCLDCLTLKVGRGASRKAMRA